LSASVSAPGRLESAKATIAQGVIPQPHGLSHHTQAAMLTASHQAVTGSLHLAFTLIAAVALAASLAALGLVNTESGRS
jgi:hypothetical protein